jgi:addiction module RelE/StbE family toxin
MRLVFDTKAIADFESIRQFISHENPRAADTVLEHLLAAALKLVAFPGMGREGEEAGTREFVVRGLPYLMIYKVDTRLDELVIVAVHHTSRSRRPKLA